MDKELQERLLDSIEANRLVLVCGAGLSMAPPSKVPSAKMLAVESAAKYETKHGWCFPEDVREDLGKLAEFFAARNELYSTFINTLLPLRSFHRDPNAGHIAAADFVASGVVECLVSTNVDYLIEEAGKALGESHVPADIDGDEANTSKGRKPHLKIHGCLTRDPKNTVWCKSQLQTPRLKTRHEQFKVWLAANLRERDLIFLGFWTDWAYLNDLFQEAIGGIDNGLVVIVNYSDEVLLESKAPMLWKWSGSEQVDRRVVRQSAHEFLDELRAAVWRSFLERLHRESLPTYKALTGNSLKTLPSLPAGLSSGDLYDLHLDTCGVPKGDVSRRKRPDTSMQTLGAVQIGLLSQGAQVQGNHFILNTESVRVIYGQGLILSEVQKRYQDEVPEFIKPDKTICVGAKDAGGAPLSVVRGVPNEPTILRPNSLSNWLTDESARPTWAAGYGEQDAATARG